MLARRPRWPQRFRARGANVVVLYHRIADDPQDAAGMTVPPELFARQVAALAERFDIVPAAQVHRVGPRPAAAITFDDGYADNDEVALPLLRRLGLPATLFVVSGVLDDPQEFWWDRLEHLVLERLPAHGVRVVVGRRPFALPLSGGSERTRSLQRLSTALMTRHRSEIERVLAELERRAGPPDPGPCRRHARVPAHRLAALAAEPLLEIGSHTCTHAALGRLSRAASGRELRDSRERLHEVLGHRPRLLAYPFGAPGTVRRREAAEARRAGYERAFVNVTGPAEGADPFAVPRVSVGRWEPQQFLAALTRWSR
ncbi:polysaccharide deacetylase family protein [Kineococcus aurantiacus]|uniref:Peptidoglycan/xylan/chitin deacetylase (PgdA/CDA1 family) n=1 Tax=Kineococcus aurantiacus TaxID=37633 RepID=A0A7Y9DPM0_9ACTN|nr:peptidoglycan/xylan/chitin deacetylase (PgdA/CDA1 family) [Kineococcus aurantiacus]